LRNLAPSYLPKLSGRIKKPAKVKALVLYKMQNDAGKPDAIGKPLMMASYWVKALVVKRAEEGSARPAGGGLLQGLVASTSTKQHPGK
jgi:hypothetical protein